MIRFIRQAGTKLLAMVALEDDRDKFLLLFSVAEVLFSFFVHIFLFSIYTIYGLYQLSLLNAVSLLVYVFCCWLISRRYFCQCSVIISIEIGIYVAFSAYFVGLEGYSVLYLFIIQLLNIIVSYASIRVRFVMCVFLYASLTLATLIDAYTPAILYVRDAEEIIMIFNIQITFIGIVILLFVRSAITEIITNYNRKKLSEYKNYATIDPLTGLYNRRYADEFFLKMTRRQNDGTWIIAMLDVDHFKQVNDTYGHHAGDEVLCMVSKALTSSLRKTDRIFRWGGEEFLVCLKDVPLKEANRILNQTRESIMQSKIVVAEKTINVTITMGATQLDPLKIKESIAQCDALMYRGKQNGRNQVVLDTACVTPS